MITEKEFLEMEDRERDAWVADTFFDGERYWTSRNNYVLGVHSEKPAAAWGEGRIMQYRDYNAMHRVIKKMEDNGYSWETGYDLNAHYIWFSHADSDKMFSARCWNMPLFVQVPIAAGRAKGVIE